jgi:hypothetical protein
MGQYMNGLAADRRRRGLAGSVLNIGVIYGLGFLHRGKSELYCGLEREGYPPISERDLHHMFLEAIVAGKPVPGQVADLTTGLSRFRVGDLNALHWHRDPRFSHFTVRGKGVERHTETSHPRTEQSVSEKVDAAGSADEAAAALVQDFCRRLEGILQSSAGTINGEHSCGELGVDSLIAVEIRAWFWKTLGKDVPVLRILGSASIATCR